MFRTGRTLGTTIYANDSEQPVAWVPDNPGLAQHIVDLLNNVVAKPIEETIQSLAQMVINTRGLKRGSNAWVQAVAAYSDDKDVKLVCSLLLSTRTLIEGEMEHVTTEDANTDIEAGERTGDDKDGASKDGTDTGHGE